MIRDRRETTRKPSGRPQLFVAGRARPAQSAPTVPADDAAGKSGGRKNRVDLPAHHVLDRSTMRDRRPPANHPAQPGRSRVPGPVPPRAPRVTAPGKPVEPRHRPPTPLEDADDVLPTIYLRPGEADRVVGGHPWVYEGCILREVREPEDGGIVQVKDHRRRLLGTGFYNSKSKIRVRILSGGREELDEAFLTRRIEAALAHRHRFMPEATSFRVVNAEGDLLSGLIVDKYEDVLVVQMSSLGMDRRKDTIVRILERLLQPRAILERNDMGSRKFEGLPNASGVLSGTLTEAEQSCLPVRLNGLRFVVNLQSGHKTGLYLDQQENHRRVAQLTRGARVLDAFCFLGGFGLHAAAAGAASVLGIDQSAEAVGIAGQLAAANQVESRCSFETANVFDWLRARTSAPETPADGADPAGFDVVILDPPSFTRNRASVPDALRGYKEIHLRAFRLVRPGGIVATFCCSHHVDAVLFESVIREAAYDARRTLRRVAQYGQGHDHPILPAVPETEYLKGFAYELLAA